MLALPLADSTVEQADREHLAFSYVGILSTAPVEVAFAALYADWEEGPNIYAVLE